MGGTGGVLLWKKTRPACSLQPPWEGAEDGCKCEGWPSADTRPVLSLVLKFLIPEFWEINSLFISNLVYVWLLFAGLGLNPGSHVQFMLHANLFLLLGKCSLWYFCYRWLEWRGTVKQPQPLKSYILTNRWGRMFTDNQKTFYRRILSLSLCV